MENWKEIIGALLGAGIAVTWVSLALLQLLSNRLFLAIAISLTILLGTTSGMFYASSKEAIGWKEAVGAVLGAAIAVAWVSWALVTPGDTVGLVIAIAITIIFGTLSGGLYALSEKEKKSGKAPES